MNAACNQPAVNTTVVTATTSANLGNSNQFHTQAPTCVKHKLCLKLQRLVRRSHGFYNRSEIDLSQTPVLWLGSSILDACRKQRDEPQCSKPAIAVLSELGRKKMQPADCSHSICDRAMLMKPVSLASFTLNFTRRATMLRFAGYLRCIQDRCKLFAKLVGAV